MIFWGKSFYFKIVEQTWKGPMYVNLMQFFQSHAGWTPSVGHLRFWHFYQTFRLEKGKWKLKFVMLGKFFNFGHLWACFNLKSTLPDPNFLSILIFLTFATFFSPNFTTLIFLHLCRFYQTDFLTFLPILPNWFSYFFADFTELIFLHFCRYTSGVVHEHWDLCETRLRTQSWMQVSFWERKNTPSSIDWHNKYRILLLCVYQRILLPCAYQTIVFYCTYKRIFVLTQEICYLVLH